MAEGRLSRWSRLKQKGGADQREESDIQKTREVEKQAVAEAEPETFNLPGGVRVRHFVPAMAPLAPEPEEDDDRLTRGIGHLHDGGEPDVQALQDGPSDPEIDEEVIESEEVFDTEIDETSFTDEEKEVASTLPPLESLNGDSDFTPFMKDGVPEVIKRKAMRILWKSNPFFGFRDGLNDYDEDFNIVHRIIDESVGAYQVGRGHLTEEELQNMMPEEAKRAFDEDEDEDEEELTEEAKLSEDGENEEAEIQDSADAVETDPGQISAEQSDITDIVDDDDDTDTDDTDDLIR